MERYIKVTKILIEAKEPITVDTIAKRVNVCNKTIRNDLKKIENILTGYDLKLDKRQGVGVSIEGKDEQKLALISQIKVSKEIEPFSPLDRRNYILKRLYIRENTVTIKKLSDELYVSRVTIHNDLKNVEEWLNQFDLRLIRKTNYGIEVSGKEENLRNAVATLIAQNVKSEKLKEFLYEDYSERMDYKTLVKLKELVNIDYKKLQEIVVDVESMLKFRFSDEAFISFVIHLAISIKRLKQNKDIELPKEIIEELKKKEEYCIAQNIANRIEEVFEIKLPESEIGYILFHILGAKMQQNSKDEIDVDLAYESKNELSVIMAKEIVSISEKLLDIDLSSDKQLLNGLILHLIPTINRLKYGLTLRNPILNEIKENYPEIYGAAWMTSKVFEKYLGVKINEEEVGYLALHLAAGVERHEKPLRTLVICTSGIGTSQLLAVKLKKHFKQISIKEIIPLSDLNEGLLKNIDIIISTVPIEVNKPMISISPLLTENDLKRLDSFITHVNDSKKY